MFMVKVCLCLFLRQLQSGVGISYFTCSGVVTQLVSGFFQRHCSVGSCLFQASGVEGHTGASYVTVSVANTKPKKKTYFCDKIKEVTRGLQEPISRITGSMVHDLKCSDFGVEARGSSIILCAAPLPPGSTQDLLTNHLGVLSGCDPVSKEFSQQSQAHGGGWWWGGLAQEGGGI